MLESLEKMLAKGVDNSLLRFGLGKGYLDLGENAKAAEHFQRCVGFVPLPAVSVHSVHRIVVCMQ